MGRAGHSRACFAGAGPGGLAVQSRTLWHSLLAPLLQSHLASGIWLHWQRLCCLCIVGTRVVLHLPCWSSQEGWYSASEGRTLVSNRFAS